MKRTTGIIARRPARVALLMPPKPCYHAAPQPSLLAQRASENKHLPEPNQFFISRSRP